VHLFRADFLGENSEIKLEEKELAEWRWVNADDLQKLIESPAYLAKILEIINAIK
jgi:NADH pyrophosphatase NudC (nudix superfamily)